MDHKSCLSTLCILCLDLGSADGDRLCKPWDLNMGFGSTNKDVVVQLLSCIQLSVTPWTVAYQDSLSFTISWSLLKFLSIESVMLSNYHTSASPFFCLESFPASGSFPMSQFFATSGQCIRTSTSFISPNVYSGLIFFRMDWFDLLVVHGTLKSLL